MWRTSAELASDGTEECAVVLTAAGSAGRNDVGGAGRTDTGLPRNFANTRLKMPEAGMCSCWSVQLNNITPTGPKSGKYFIPGIRGLAVGSSSTQ